MTVKIKYFVHSTTTDNENKIATGWAPGKLSEIGLKQAKELGELVSDNTFDIVFCSDLKRASDSAKIGFGNKYMIIEDSRLRECNYGDFNQQLASKFINEKEKYIDTPFPNGESYKDVEKRIASFLHDLKKNYESKYIAIISHMAPQFALEVLINGKSWKKAFNEDWRPEKKWQPGWIYYLN